MVLRATHPRYCRVAHLPGKPVVAVLLWYCRVALLLGKIAVWPWLRLFFKKTQPKGLTFEGTYTSERFLTSRSVRRGQWVYIGGV